MEFVNLDLASGYSKLSTGIVFNLKLYFVTFECLESLAKAGEEVPVPVVRPLREAAVLNPLGRWMEHPCGDISTWWKILPHAFKKD